VDRFFALVITLLVASFALGQQPSCDGVNCFPDPVSTTYTATRAARPALENARGASNTTSPPRGPYPIDPPVPKRIVVGSESYNYAIPVLSLPGRNGLDLNLTLFYNSRLWTIARALAKTATYNADRDWPGYGFRIGFGHLEYDSNNNFYILTEADGSKRQLAATTASSFDSTDASYMNFNSATKTLTYKAGTKVLYENFPSSTTLLRPKQITDTNGNYISITYILGKDQDIKNITDTVSRIITFNYTNNQLTSITQGTRIWLTLTWGTASLTYNFTTGTGGLPVKDTQPSGSTINVITACKYADNTGYTFQYGDWGIINRIAHTASGGAERSYRSYRFLSISPSIVTAPTYDQTTDWDGTSTSISDFATIRGTNGLVSSYSVTGDSGAATKTTLFSNGDWMDGLTQKVESLDGTTLLRTVTTDWTADATSNRNPRPLRMTSTLANYSSSPSKVEYTYDSYGNITNSSEYDFGGLLKRQTLYTYLATSVYTTRHILDRITKIQVQNNLGQNATRTDFAYDAGTLTSVTSSGQHDDANYGSAFTTRGNLTSTTTYTIPGGSGAISHNFTYNTLGDLLSADMDCCVQRRWAYSVTTKYGYPDSVTSGPVAGPTLVQSFTYDLPTGHTLTTTDQNGTVTSFTYDATTKRLSSWKRASGTTDEVQYSTIYDDTSSQAVVTHFSNANTARQVSTYDGFGRVVRQQLRDGATTVVSTIDTSYNDANRTVAVTNPYGPLDSPIATITTTDALNRKISVAPPSPGGSYTYEYAANYMTATDPAGKQRRTYTDALGRLVRVDEPGWGDDSPGTGSVSISGLEGQRQNCAFDENHVLICDPVIYDGGTVSITVGTSTKSVNYGQGSTPTAIATALATAMTSDLSFPATGGSSGPTLFVTSRVPGAATNYSLSALSATADPEDFSQPSFTATASGTTLIGGSNATIEGSPSLDHPMITLYTYDAADRLTQASVAAQGIVNGSPVNGQVRTYVYDGLSRPTTVTTPESGIVTTTFKTFGGIDTRTDARGVVATYGYDGLSRLIGISYNVGTTGVLSTPGVTYTYGTSATSFNNGKLINVTDGAGSEAYTYNRLAHVVTVARTTGGRTYTTQYAYNKADEPTAITYPSGRVLTTIYDALGSLQKVLDGTRTYLDQPTVGAMYNPAGEPLGWKYGNTVAAQLTYNNRLQLSGVQYTNAAGTLLNMTYDYGMSNNGEIASVTDTLDATRSTTYTYDAWSRLKTAQAGGVGSETWKYGYDYDRLGNRKAQNLTAGTGYQKIVAINDNTNRVSTAGYSYDVAGNLTNDTFHQYKFDAENRLVAVDTTAVTYIYGAGPLRIKRSDSTGTKISLFSGAMPIAEYNSGAVGGSPNKEFIYAGAQLIATVTPGSPTETVVFQHQDLLSIRLQTDASGNWIKAFGQMPHGEVWYECTPGTPPPCAPASTNPKFFTSYDRDPTSQLDYAIFRNYSASLGRFISADPLAGAPSNPASLNRYVYVLGNPINNVDFYGLQCGTEPGYNDCPPADPPGAGQTNEGPGGGGRGQLTRRRSTDCDRANQSNVKACVEKQKQRKSCIQTAQQNYNQAVSDAKNTAVRAVALGTLGTVIISGIAGCAVGSGVGGFIGAAATWVFGGEGGVVGAGAGCGEGGALAAEASIPMSVAVGVLVGGAQYKADLGRASDQLASDLTTCEANFLHE
jgi:RHS repeat-associated protein